MASSQTLPLFYPQASQSTYGLSSYDPLQTNPEHQPLASEPAPDKTPHPSLPTKSRKSSYQLLDPTIDDEGTVWNKTPRQKALRYAQGPLFFAIIGVALWGIITGFRDWSRTESAETAAASSSSASVVSASWASSAASAQSVLWASESASEASVSATASWGRTTASSASASATSAVRTASSTSTKTGSSSSGSTTGR